MVGHRRMIDGLLRAARASLNNKPMVGGTFGRGLPKPGAFAAGRVPDR